MFNDALNALITSNMSKNWRKQKIGRWPWHWGWHALTDKISIFIIPCLEMFHVLNLPINLKYTIPASPP